VARNVLRQCYRNLADTIVEAFWGFGASAEQLKARVKFADAELIRRAIDRRQTIVLLAAHHGNWEWLLLAAGANFPIPIDVVYQPQRSRRSTSSCATCAAASAASSFRASSSSTSS
jgi:KDO2-lipid IV(A) lauroyltransferase